MQDVFISYSTKDQLEADLVKRVLESNGISCWMAPGNIPSGSNYAREIPGAIRQTRIFLLLLSRAAQASKWVPKELDLAVNEMKVIIPFMLEDCEILDEFNFYLIGAQRLNAYCQRAEALQVLVNRIHAVLSADEPICRQADQVSRAVHSPRAVSEEALAAFAQEYIGRDMITGHKAFKPRNMQALRNALQIPETDEVFLAHDDTLFRTGKNGFAMCTSGMYCLELMEKMPTYMSWRTFIEATEFKFKDMRKSADLYACTPDGDIQMAYVNLLGEPDRKLLVRFLERLREAMHHEFA